MMSTCTNCGDPVDAGVTVCEDCIRNLGCDSDIEIDHVESVVAGV